MDLKQIEALLAATPADLVTDELLAMGKDEERDSTSQRYAAEAYNRMLDDPRYQTPDTRAILEAFDKLFTSYKAMKRDGAPAHVLRHFLDILEPLHYGIECIWFQNTTVLKLFESIRKLEDENQRLETRLADTRRPGGPT